MHGDTETAIAGRTAIPVQPYHDNRCWPYHLAAGAASAAPRVNTRWPSDPYLAQPAAAHLPACTNAEYTCQRRLLCWQCGAQAGHPLLQCTCSIRTEGVCVCLLSADMPIIHLQWYHETSAAAGPGSNPAVANTAAFSAMQNANMPAITSVVFDGFLSDCTVSCEDVPQKGCHMHQKCGWRLI